MRSIPLVRALVATMLAIVLGLLAPGALGHPRFSATALVKIDARGEFSLTLSHDALAFALDETPADIADAPMFEFLDATETTQAQTFLAGRDRFQSLFVLNADGRRVDVEILEAPTVESLRDWRRANGDRRLPVRMIIIARATLPQGSRGVSIAFPKVLGDVIVTIERPNDEPLGLPLRPGESTPPLEWRSASAGDAAGQGPGDGSGGGNGARGLQTPVRQLSALDVAWRYAWLGFTHIIPGGPDHGLFVLGLFLLSPRLKSLVWQITAFTIAHSVTLTLTTLHIFALQSRIVETTIAASIAFIAVENLATTKVHAWRPVVAFVFGLLHGMGFASALGEVGLPTGQLVAGLVSFNVGVECGHLGVLAAAFLMVGWWRDKPWYRSRVVIPASLAIGSIATFWMVQRALGPG